MDRPYLGEPARLRRATRTGTGTGLNPPDNQCTNKSIS